MRITPYLAAPLIFMHLTACQSTPPSIYEDVKEISIFYEQGQVIFNTSISNQGDEHFFTDSNGPQSSPTSIWVRTQNSSKKIPTSGLNIPADVHITPDGQTLFVVDYGREKSTVFELKREGDGWSKPKESEDLNLGSGSGYPSSTTAGNFVFSSGGDVYFKDQSGVKKLPSSINSSKDELDPFIAQDGSFLIFVRQQAEIGDSNMFISLKSGEGWSVAQKLPAPFNLEKVDGSPYVTPDKKYLFFSSNRDGSILRTYQAPFLEYWKQLISAQ